MKKSPVRFLLISLIAAVLVIGLFRINRDLFTFSYETRCERTFEPASDAKQDYLVHGPVTLKPGAYVLSFDLRVSGKGSGIFLLDGDDNEFFAADLPDGSHDPSFPFEITGRSKQVRIGIRYGAGDSSVELKWIRITGEHILYRDSFLRHMTVSVLWCLVCILLVLRLFWPEVFCKFFPLFSRPENELAFLLCAALTAAACWPFLGGKVYIHGDDMFFHVTRIRGLADSLRAGYFPVRDQLYWLHNYGYGVGYFYPDLFLYFPAALVLLGFDLLTAYNIFLVVCTFCSVVSVWFACFRIAKNRTAAAASAVMMAFSAYRLIIIYGRAALGETQAAVFYPLIILGLYEIFYGNKNRWPWFAFGFWGITGCHLISLAIALVITVLFLLTQVRKIIKAPEIILCLLKSVLVVAGLSAFFWLPMLEQHFTNPGLRINQVLSGDTGLNIANYAFPVKNLFRRFIEWDSIPQAQSVYPGWVFWLPFLMRVVVWKSRKDAVRTGDFLLAFSLPLLWMCTRAFPWEQAVFLPLVTRIQFAYRFLLPAAVLVVLAGGIYFSAVSEKIGSPRVLFAVLTLFCFFSTCFPVLRNAVMDRSVAKNWFVMQDNRVSGEEYLPSGLDRNYPGKNMDTVRLSGSGVPLTVTAHKRERLGFSFSYELPEDSGPVHFSVPLIWYTGFRGQLTAADGSVFFPEIGRDEQGLVSLGNNGISRGTVSVYYQKTPVQWIGECITVLSALIPVTGIIRYKKRVSPERKA